MKTANRFQCKQPCPKCPYRRDAPRRMWHISEFVKVLESEADELGKVFRCHLNNGGVCVGWLMNQVKRDLPSIMLRFALHTHDIAREYLDGLRSPAPMFRTVHAMIRANYPSLLRKRKA